MDIDSIIAELRQTFDSGKTRPIAWRKEQLRNLYNLVIVSSWKGDWFLEEKADLGFLLTG
jgi:aldehyde dehydrogenase (NAD+)/aldehyde dehydrogenase (NAD(P)+)/beta-apo-4'-carotenal oxygenase